MPQLTIRGIAPERVAQVSRPLIDQLASLLETEAENFTLDLLPTASFFCGEQVPTFPFVLVGWFDRGQEVQDQAASIIDSAFKQVGVAELEIAFTLFSKTAYYANGQHY